MSFGASRVWVVCGVVALCACPSGPPAKACQSNAECDDGSACTIDTCDETLACAHVAVKVDDANACTTDGCDALSGVTHLSIDLSDSNACTLDACDPKAGVTHTLVDVDDHDMCTTDSCDATGVHHLARDVDDLDGCTVDSCDLVTGPKHVAVSIDDENPCTFDSCTASGGVMHELIDADDQDQCTIDACNPVTGEISNRPFDVDDHNACTTDSCSSITGPSHVPVDIDDHDACSLDSCDASTGVRHVAIVVDDQNACTTDSCNVATGVSNVPVDVDDHNACTTDSCNVSTGVSHLPVDLDDHNVCTSDSCSPSTGPAHTPIPPASDGIACTDDVCDPVTGVSHVPVNSRCDSDGKSCTVAVCSVVSGCSETVTNSVCDDGVSCNLHQCVGAAGDSVGCAPKTPIDGSCDALQVCKPTGCQAQTGPDQRGFIIVSELIILGSEVVELRNTTATAIDVRGYQLKNGANAKVDLRAVADLSGTLGTAVIVPANGQIFGVANPASASPQSGATFVYGARGTTFALGDTGDSLSLYSTSGVKLEDTVDFRQFVTSATLAPGANDFVGFTGASTQLHPGSLSAQGNDLATAWCVTFASATTKSRRPDTLGAANGSCGAVVLNELMIRSSTSDDGNTYVELAGPGGASVSQFTIGDLLGGGALASDGDVGPGETDGLVKLPLGTRLPVDGYLIIADGVNSGPNGFGMTLVANVTPGVDLIVRDMDLSNGPGSVQLLSDVGALVDVVGHDPTGSALSSSIGYNGLATYEGSVATTPPADRSLARRPESLDTGGNSSDFGSLSNTPGAINKILGASLSVHLTLGQPDDAAVNVSMVSKYLMLKPQYVLSYNGVRKNPNYSAFELNASWKGPVPRQNNYRADDTLPGAIPQASLSDYSGNPGGWQRGHMCASDDRDGTVADNSATFYLTNMVPQAGNNNTGAWQKLEGYLQCLAVAEGKEIFIVAGGLYEGATQYVQSGSTVQVPTHTWKVATILSAPGQGVNDVTASTRTIAVVMPNDNALIVGSAPWRPYRVSVREVEMRTGFNFNSDVGTALQDTIENPVDAVATTCTCPSGLTCAAGTY